MEVLGIVWLLAEAGVVIGQETRQQLIAGGNRTDPLKTQFLDQAILQGLVGALDAALRLRRVGAQNVDVEGVQRAPELGHAVALDGPGAIDPKDAVLVAVERDRCHAPRDTRGSLGSSRRSIPSRRTSDASGGWWRRRYRRAACTADRGPRTTNARSRRAVRVHRGNRAASAVGGRA